MTRLQSYVQSIITYQLKSILPFGLIMMKHTEISLFLANIRKKRTLVGQSFMCPEPNFC